MLRDLISHMCFTVVPLRHSSSRNGYIAVRRVRPIAMDVVSTVNGTLPVLCPLGCNVRTWCFSFDFWEGIRMG